ncbi:hypothetical protein CYLTODRAFT_439964, partial [Cylindrobasidium torrendii FP15055 ss-10]
MSQPGPTEELTLPALVGIANRQAAGIIRLRARETVAFNRAKKCHTRRMQHIANTFKRLRPIRTELLRRLAHNHNADPSGARRLPKETLLDIFALAIASSSTMYDSLDVQKNALWTLGHVCSGWRSMIVSIPEFWSNLWTDDSSSPRLEWSSGRRELWELAVSRSSPGPLDILHIGISSEGAQSSLSALVFDTKRLRSISFNVANSFSGDSLVNLVNLEFPLLTTFSLDVESTSGHYVRAPYDNYLFLNAPALENVTLRGIGQIPNLTRSPIHRLSIAEMGDTTALKRAFEIPSLEEIEVWPPWSHRGFTTITSGQNLRRLTVYGRPEFSNICCPGLRMLTIVDNFNPLSTSLPIFLENTQVDTLILEWDSGLPFLLTANPERPMETLSASLIACSERLSILSTHIHTAFASDFYASLTLDSLSTAPLLAPNLTELYLCDDSTMPAPSSFNSTEVVRMVESRPKLRQLGLCAVRSEVSVEEREVIHALKEIEVDRPELTLAVHWGYRWTNVMYNC